MEETAPVWYILTGDHICFDDKVFEVLDKNLVPLGNEVGFCLCTKGRTRLSAPGNSSVGPTKSPASTTERTNMPYYRKKPILVEARQYTGDNFLELQDWSADHVELSDYRDDAICVYTPEGLLWFDEGDYVIKGARGEFYPCQKDIFEETYEKVN